MPDASIRLAPSYLRFTGSGLKPIDRADIPDFLRSPVPFCSPEAHFVLNQNAGICVEHAGELNELLEIWRFIDDSFVITHIDDVRETAVLLSGVSDYILFGPYLSAWMLRIAQLDRYHAWCQGYTPPARFPDDLAA